MRKKIARATPEIIDRLKKSGDHTFSAFLGFDACIDIISGVVKGKREDGSLDYFTGSREFGQFLVQHENKSCGIELRTRVSKPGGNMVIMGNSLGNLGINVVCAGTFGYPSINPVFRSMSENCTLFTIGEEISTTALEFNDAKVMMFDPGPYDKLSWESIRETIGIPGISSFFSGKQLVCLLNWSEIENTSKIWKGIQDDILPGLDFKGQRPLFLSDFSDCSRKSGGDIREALELVRKFRNYFSVILSMNQNEAELIAAALDVDWNSGEESFIKNLYEIGIADELVIHRSKDALAFDGTKYETCDTFYCREPVLLTGGGDNFNAGYSMARLLKLDLFQSLLTANAVSGYYVSNGRSPGMEHLLEFLKKSL